jgi:hypothetical protein
MSARTSQILRPGPGPARTGWNILEPWDRDPGPTTPPDQTQLPRHLRLPDGELVTVDEVIGRAEDARFELRDAESLRTSYALTLRHWVDNLETNRQAALGAADQTTYRIWRLYMASAVIGFETASTSVYQLLFETTVRPWTFGRSHLLAPDDQ